MDDFWKCTRLILFALALTLDFQACFAITQDESVRSYLEHFYTIRNNQVSPALKTVARDYIMKTFKDFGLDTWTEEFSSDQKNFLGINIIGRVNGSYTGTSKDKILIIAAHYDTVATTQGVDDNGSGVTVLLQALRQYKSSTYINYIQNHTLLFVAFDLKEKQLSCQAGLCGSKHFVGNLTRYVDNLKATVQGAYVLETVMNYNTTPNSQSLPQGINLLLPKEYSLIRDAKFTGDWLAVIGRQTDDSIIRKHFVENFKQGAFKTLPISLPFNGKPSDIQDFGLKHGISHFLRNEPAEFWNSNNSWPSLFITDTADFRGYMRTCYHQQCDNMDRVTPEMITFMGKTADALVGAAQSLTERVHPIKERNAATDQIKSTAGLSGFFAMLAVLYIVLFI